MTNSWPDQPLRLEILGLGHVPAMKNNKMLTRGRLITHPKRQKWMDQAIRAIEFQLMSLFQTTAGETWTEPQLHSWIASRWPLDDSCAWIKELVIKVRPVPKGSEGAAILIERL